MPKIKLGRVAEFMKKEVLEHLFSSVVAAKEVKEITGLSYKQIKEWNKKSILPCRERDSDGARQWRRFSGSDVLKLCILKELRNAGIPPLDLYQLVGWLKDNEKGLLKEIMEEITHGSEIFLSTNLKDKFFLIPSSEKINNALFLAYNDKDADAKICMRININQIVNDILKTLNQKPLR